MFTKAPTIVLLCLLTTAAVAQPEQAVPSPGQTDIISLRAEKHQLEQQMYDVFNRLNSNDDEAAFMRDANSSDVAGRWDNQTGGAANTQGGFIPQSSKQLAFKSRKKTRQLNDEMMALARQHPELATAMIALNNKRKQLEKAEK